jgi:cell division protein FtsB
MQFPSAKKIVFMNSIVLVATSVWLIYNKRAMRELDRERQDLDARVKKLRQDPFANFSPEAKRVLYGPAFKS